MLSGFQELFRMLDPAASLQHGVQQQSKIFGMQCLCTGSPLCHDVIYHTPLFQSQHQTWTRPEISINLHNGFHIVNIPRLDLRACHLFRYLLATFPYLLGLQWDQLMICGIINISMVHMYPAVSPPSFSRNTSLDMKWPIHDLTIREFGSRSRYGKQCCFCYCKPAN